MFIGSFLKCKIDYSRTFVLGKEKIKNDKIWNP